MPVHRAAGYPQCNIECPGAGYAVFRAPDGPCIRGCIGSDTKAQRMMLQGFVRNGDFAATLHEVPSSWIIEVLHPYLDHELLRALETSREPLTISMKNGKLDQLLEEIAEAVGVTRPDFA